MEHQRLCSDCFLLIRRQLITTHENLVERNHIYNDTIYECNSCHNLIKLSHVPHQWSVLEEDQLAEQTAKTA